VPQPRGGRLQTGIVAEMKTATGRPAWPKARLALVSKLEAGSVLRQPTQRTLEGLQPAEIVGEVANPVLEAARRFGQGLSSGR
jgi:hypothetical protein